ncbi:MAG: putative bifunctional diguanylate cyclase/phosphodiesterase, partial [Acidimicrobiales bacterium]
DSLGHDVGDRLLRAVADRMTGALRASDTLSRYGGDEFTVLCEDVRDETHALEIAERLRRSLRRPVTVAGGVTFVSCSMGIALTGATLESGASLLRQADIAMYRAKERGAGGREIYAGDDPRPPAGPAAPADDLRGALERKELELHYQPVVDLRRQSVIGIEAVVRWHHPTRGLLRPDEFPTGVDDPLSPGGFSAWALGRACRQVAAWDAAGHEAGRPPSAMTLAVNLAGHHLTDPDFPDLVADVLAATTLDPGRLWLALTESAVMRDAGETTRVLRDLRRLGIHFVIDDFGTGYSSLAHLRHFPVEALKIDRSFVRQVDHRTADTAVVRAIMAVAESLGLAVIADGVDNRDQATRLASLGCLLAQGDLFAPARPAEDIAPFPVSDLAAWPRLLENSAT